MPNPRGRTYFSSSDSFCIPSRCRGEISSACPFVPREKKRRSVRGTMDSGRCQVKPQSLKLIPRQDEAAEVQASGFFPRDVAAKSIAMWFRSCCELHLQNSLAVRSPCFHGLVAAFPNHGLGILAVASSAPSPRRDNLEAVFIVGRCSRDTP